MNESGCGDNSSAAFPLGPSDKDLFPADGWRWALQEARITWEVLAANGGTLEAKALRSKIAKHTGNSADSVRIVCGKGLFMLETFGLISVERRPLGTSGKRTVYGRVEIVKTEIDRDELKANHLGNLESYRSRFLTPGDPISDSDARLPHSKTR